MTTIRKRCPDCQRLIVGRVTTDGRGHDIDEWPRCICKRLGLRQRPSKLSLPYTEREAAARQTGICMDCDRPVDGRRGTALRCAACRGQAIRARARRRYGGPLPELRCLTCGERIERSSHRGRPAKYHQTPGCSPYHAKTAAQRERRKERAA